jgi:aldehyde:ferredoxin oxidoreductase
LDIQFHLLDRIICRPYQPLENGILKGKSMDREKFKDMKKDYYRYMGFDEKGNNVTKF